MLISTRTFVYHIIVTSSSLSILDRAVIPEWGVEHFIHRWVLPNGGCTERNTEAWALRDNQIALLQCERLLQELTLGRLRLAGVFLQGKVGNTGVELDARRGADR